MILIEDTHWPLVVIGVCCGPRLDTGHLRRARERWRSLDPRSAVLVVPCHGERALSAHDSLLRWLDVQPAQTALCQSAAWVVPDEALRSTIRRLQRSRRHVAFGGPSATFASVAEALRWSCGVAGVEKSTAFAPERRVNLLHTHP